MQQNAEFRHPSADEVNRIIQEAHRLRAQAFKSMLTKAARAIKGAVYPKGVSTGAKVA